MSIINSQPLIGASGNQGYNIQRSLRFRSSASAYLNRTPASATNRRTWTWSGWVKRGVITGDYPPLFNAGQSAPDTVLRFFNDDTISATLENGGGGNSRLLTTAVYRDPSAWYHIVWAVDTTQATADNRQRLYVNGVEITSFGTRVNPSQNLDTSVNNTVEHRIGGQRYPSYYDGYLAEINFIDGQALTPSSFGQTNSATGVWQPAKYTGTYGTNGFYLPFTNTTSTSTLGNDFSGNSNTWTVNNISLTSGSTYDSMTDVPTLTNATTANYCVLNPLKNALTLSSANLNWVGISSGQKNAFSSIAVTSGKWYFEANLTNTSVTGNWGVGLCNDLNASNTSILGNTANGWVLYTGGGGANLRKYNNSVDVQIYSAATSIGATIGVAFDIDAGKIWFSRNNVWLEGDPSAGTTPSYSNLTGTVQAFVYGYDSNDQGSINFGQRPFAYTPPTGFVALNTFNLPTPTIGATASSQADDYFNVLTWTGDGTTSRSLTGLSFQPDFVWIKQRSTSISHTLYNSIVGGGANKSLASNNTDSESSTNANSVYGYLNTFDSNGFSVVRGSDGSISYTNVNSGTYVAWNWKANGSSSTNTAGSITSTVSANTTAGFSIVTYTGNNTSGATVGHGLGVAPAFYIVKQRTASSATSWYCYHSSIDATPQNYAIYLNLTNAKDPSSLFWNNTAPTSSVFSLGTSSGVNGSSGTYVAYCFAQVAGYSAFGSYTGNGSSDGSFVFTGFRPRYVLIKDTTNTNDWFVMDTARGTYNTIVNYLNPNKSLAEQTDLVGFDILSNGFKVRQAGALNNNNANLIYMAFAENPFKYSLAR